MIITGEKIKVSEQMMFNNGLSKFMIIGKLGIPHSKEKKEPITWKEVIDITGKEFDLIEDYFIHNKIKAY